MTETLLTTKLYMPRLSVNFVPRPRLYELMDQSLTRKLTLISAPAGFGKSSLVTGWISESAQPAAWISLDQGDNDSVRFWSYLVAAIQTIHQEIGGEARQIVRSPQLHSLEPVMISLINDISKLGDDLILVLDDYHIIESRQVHAGVSYLLEHQPPNLHIVLITRVDPSIPLGRLRAHSQLNEIRAQDLQFSTEEAAALFNEKMGLNLRTEHIEALNAHTENWVVGLQLAALSLKGQSTYDSFIEKFTGGHQFILDYLTEEVLTSLPESLREFMLRTSVLDRFCGELCRAVTGDPASQEMVDDIWKSNLFLIPLDTEGLWFRYHHLFAEVLLALLERYHPGEKNSLHLKAAEWFETEGHPGEAVDHALRSGDTTRAREMIMKYFAPTLYRGEVATVQHWLDGLPESRQETEPFVPLARCWALFVRGESSAIEPHLERATATYRQMVDDGTLSGPQQNLVAVQLAMMHSVLARDRGEHVKSVAHAEEATRLMTPDMLEIFGTPWNMLSAARGGAGDFNGAIEAYERGTALAHVEGNQIVEYGGVYGQAMYMILQGRLNEAESLCRSAIDRAASQGHGDLPAAGWLQITMAKIYLERYRLKEADGYLRDGLRIARPGGFGEVERSGRYIQAHLAAARGDLDTAVDIFQDTEQIVSAMDDHYLTGELNREWARLYLKTGNLDAAREKLNILEEKIATTQHALLLLGQRFLLPLLLCVEKRYQEALAALEASIHQTRAGHSNGELIRLLALQAVVLDALEDRVAVRSVLLEAFALGAPEGYIWRWLDAGPRIGPLLSDLRSAGGMLEIQDLYLDSLLDACQAAFGEPARPQLGELVPPLTRRELEVLRLICKGYSNPEIAGELVVTLNTIKKHTSNIYGKLGVRSRTQAIGRAQELNLL